MPSELPAALYWPTLLHRSAAPSPQSGATARMLRVAVYAPWREAWLLGMAQAGFSLPTTALDDTLSASRLAQALVDVDVVLLPDGPLAGAACAAGLPVWVLGTAPAAVATAMPCALSISMATDAVAEWKEIARRLAQWPNEADATVVQCLERGRLALEAGNVTGACAQFWALWREYPMLARAAGALAVCAHRNGLIHPAVAMGLRACRLDPLNAESHSNLGAFLKQLGELETACAYQQRAVDIAPHSAQAHSNLGNTLGALGQWERAVSHAQRAVGLAPGAAEYHYNLGVALREVTRYDDALAAFRQAQMLAGKHLKAELHIALTELLTGDMPAGWQHYDCRWDQVDAKEKRREFGVPAWQGEDLTNKTLLVHAEQGFGDSFQFLRFVPELAQRGARIVLVVQPEVHSLAARLQGVHALVASGAPLTPFDLHIPMLGIPAALGTRVETIPAAIPYLSPDANRLDAWQRKLGPPTRYRVALVWAGRPTHGNDANRSIALANLMPLLQLQNVDFFALQKGPAVAQCQHLPPDAHLRVLDADIHDFEDTAALLACMDELVTVDTSVAHLAGALGCRTRLLLPQVPDWRWLTERHDSPWYPQMRLYRQHRRGDWSEPVSALALDVMHAAQTAPSEDTAHAPRQLHPQL